MNYRCKALLLFLFAMLSFSVFPINAGSNSFTDLVNGTKIYFSHIAASDGWETEIAVLNPTTGPISGTLTSYNSSGQPLGNAMTISLNAHGRYQAEVGKSFTDAAGIAYMVFSSEVVGLKGYSKFYRGGVRASIMAAGPRTSGLFTKIDHEGWTGIAFINTATTEARVILTAYSDAGSNIAEEIIELAPGEKKLGEIGQLFSASLTQASYVGFSSNYGVVGFFLNGFGTTLLDGSQAL